MDISQRPNSVHLAVKLLYTNLILNIITAIYTLVLIANGAMHTTEAHIANDLHKTVTIGAVIIAIVFLIQFWFIRKIAHGRNWARIIYLIIFLFGLFMVVHRPTSLWSHGGLYTITSVVNFILGCIACVMLFVRSSSPWFHQR